jgi:hypothetical protein
MTIIFVFFILCGVFSIFSDLCFDDILNSIIAQTPDIKYNLAAQFYICHIILFIIVICVVYFGEADTTLQGSEDFENFKNLLKEEGLEWADLFPKSKDKH